MPLELRANVAVIEASAPALSPAPETSQLLYAGYSLTLQTHTHFHLSLAHL